MHTIKMLVTPAIASEWLQATNLQNRPISRITVAKYAADMKNGKWSDTHQGIAFREDGVLADGQHRLEAIIESNAAIEMLVTYGLTKEACSAIDTLRARKTTDAIKIGGLSDWVGKDEVSIANLIARMSGSMRGKSLSARQAVDFCEAHRDAIKFACEQFPTPRKALTQAPIKAAIACAYSRVDTGTLSRFCAALISGIISGPEESSVIRLREKLLTDPALSSRGGEMVRKNQFKLTMRAIQAFEARQDIKRLCVPAEPPYPLLSMPDKIIKE